MPALSRHDTPPIISDLPLELRQQIYCECIPNGYQLCLNKDTDDPTSTIDNLRKAHPQFSLEIEDEESVRCTEVVFLFNATEWKPPAARPTLRRLDHVRIKIGLYDYINRWMFHEDDFNCECGYHYARRDGRMAQLATMSNNLTNFLAWLKPSCAEATVKSIRIDLYENPEHIELRNGYIKSLYFGDFIQHTTSRECSLTKKGLPYCEESVAKELVGMTQYLQFNRGSMSEAAIVGYLSFGCLHEMVYWLWRRLLCIKWEPGYVPGPLGAKEVYFGEPMF